jgi:hypothetical protein
LFERNLSIGIDSAEAFYALSIFFLQSDDYRKKNKTDAEFIVDLYNIFLQRIPDPDEVTVWENKLTNNCPRDILINSFAFCDEFIRTTESITGTDITRPENRLLNNFYRGFFARFPDSGGYYSWLAQIRSAQCKGASAVCSVAYEISSAFISSQEYMGRNRNNAEFVADLYNAILQRAADPEGFQQWLMHLNMGMSRVQALNHFIDCDEFKIKIAFLINVSKK